MTYVGAMKFVPRPQGMGDVFDLCLGAGCSSSSDGDSALTTEALPTSAAPPADNVNQTDTGTTTTAADFTNIGGICKPKNFPALGSARAFQGQLNRVAQVKNFSKVATDGAIGPATLALFKKVQAAAPAGSIMGDAASCMTVAPDVDVLGQQVQAFADSLGAPAQVSGPLSTSVPTITTKSGATVLAPDAGLMGSLATLSSVEKLALLGLAGGIGYVLWNKSKKRRASGTTARRR
jgi:hypothetical protein